MAFVGAAAMEIWPKESSAAVGEFTSAFFFLRLSLVGDSRDEACCQGEVGFRKGVWEEDEVGVFVS